MAIVLPVSAHVTHYTCDTAARRIIMPRFRDGGVRPKVKVANVMNQFTVNMDARVSRCICPAELNNMSDDLEVSICMAVCDLPANIARNGSKAMLDHSIVYCR
jgi:hypothetical protein